MSSHTTMTPKPRAHAGARVSTHGMTMVELMVGVALSLFIVAVMGSVYVGSKSTFLMQESTSRLQENGRFAMDTLSQDLRMSGFRGCQGGGTQANPVTNTLNGPSALMVNFAEPIWGSRHGGAAWSPALPAPLSGLGAKPEGDVLVVRRPFGTGWSLTAPMADASAAITITPTAQILQGDWLMVADCAAAAVLQATNAAPGTSGSIQHLSSAVGLTPGVAQDSLGRAYANDAQVWRMQTLAYYLGDSLRRSGERALWVYRQPTYGAAQQTELVTGVQAMAILYGLDTDADLAADRLARADQVVNWLQVVNVRIELLLVGNNESRATKPQPYTFNGTTTTPTDSRLRTVMSVLVSLRNAVP